MVMDKSRNPVILSVIYCCENRLELASVMFINTLIDKLVFTTYMCVNLFVCVLAHTQTYTCAHCIYMYYRCLSMIAMLLN
jgi:hypothetical protein